MTYAQFSKEQLKEEIKLLENRLKAFKQKDLKLDMSRGKPSPQQLDISMDMLNITQYKDKYGTDARNYGNLEGLPEARGFFAELLNCKPENVMVGGNSSLNLMYIMVDLGYRLGYIDSEKPFKEYEKIKFLCPVPGYDRHFRISEAFGYEMINIKMTSTGPDMDEVERLVAKDNSIKGIWCVPQYSNPDGYTYSDETVQRLAALKPKAKDFKIFWDNAYSMHHLTDTPKMVKCILEESRKFGNEDMVFMFTSTSKMTFAGAGVSAVAASERNLNYILKMLFPMTISFDKMNQLRHVVYFKDKEGITQQMKKHASIIKPKFDKVLEVFSNDLKKCDGIVRWTEPEGGYFISFYAQSFTAKEIVSTCKEYGVVLTEAGASYPYGIDKEDSNIRIAPTFPSIQELTIACELFTTVVNYVVAKKMFDA